MLPHTSESSNTHIHVYKQPTSRIRKPITKIINEYTQGKAMYELYSDFIVRHVPRAEKNIIVFFYKMSYMKWVTSRSRSRMLEFVSWQQPQIKPRKQLSDAISQISCIFKQIPTNSTQLPSNFQSCSRSPPSPLPRSLPPIISIIFSSTHQVEKNYNSSLAREITRSM